MEVICLHDEAFYALVDRVYERLKIQHNRPLDRWVGTDEAMSLLNIKSKTTLQNLRDEGKIRFSQPQKKIILYDRDSIDSYLENNAHSTFLKMETQYNALEEQRHWKGYNRGQLFAQYDRELLNELIQIKSNDPYVEGIKQGKADYDREQQNLENVKQPEWLQAGRLKKAFSKSAEPPIYEVRDNDKEKER